MDLPQNPFKRALKAGKPQIGLWSSLSSNYTVEVIAGAGFDWLLLDQEHSPNDLESVLSQLQAAAAYKSHPVVRVPWNDMVTIKRMLDAGAQSLLIPYVCTAEEAKAAVAYTRYPPAGVRGVAVTTRATHFGRVKDYGKRAHEEICVLVQVETEEAMQNIEAICAVDGVIFQIVALQESFQFVFIFVGQLETRAAEYLNSVVMKWIVRCRDHDSCTCPKAPGQIGNAWGRQWT